MCPSFYNHLQPEPALTLSVALLWGNLTLFISKALSFIPKNTKQGLNPSGWLFCTETERNSLVGEIVAD